MFCPKLPIEPAMKRAISPRFSDVASATAVLSPSAVGPTAGQRDPSPSGTPADDALEHTALEHTALGHTALGHTTNTDAGAVPDGPFSAPPAPPGDPGPDVTATTSSHDRLSVFNPMIAAVRLSTVAIGLLLAATTLIDGDLATVVGTVVVAGYSTYRAIRPVRDGSPSAIDRQLLLESLVLTSVVAATGFWTSPFVFSLLPIIVISGFAGGFGYALRAAAGLAIIVGVPTILVEENHTEALTLSGTWTTLVLLIALVAGFGRKLSGQADRERDLAFDRLSRLADANTLLYSLHKVTQTLPSSLDMHDVVVSTVTQLRELFEFDSVAIVLFDETAGDWNVIRQEGCHLPDRLGSDELPPGLRQAITTAGVVRLARLGAIDGDGLVERSASGLYSALVARGTTIGLIAVEHRRPDAFDLRCANVLSGVVPALAMALDNAQWFARIRTVGADEERTRIARDLHDRIGQSLAYLAFELDRVINRSSQGDDVGGELVRLREDLRGVVREVRDTLYDLRTDVTETVPIEDTLEQYARRVEERSDLIIEVDVDSTSRLPLLQEREMWRIAQEALTNVERHANATRVVITWRNLAGRAVLRVADDGIGFQIGRSGRLDSYGMLGMRERASSIGAALEIQSTPGHGTSITCVLDPLTNTSAVPTRSFDRSTPGVRT